MGALTVTKYTYRLAGLQFTSKDAVAQHARGIKDTHKPGDVLDGEELDFMCDLLLWHPNVAEKVGAGIKAILIRANPLFGHNEFYLLRTDGSATEFSYKQCVRPSTSESDFRAACRVAIAPDILRFSQEYFRANPTNPTCPLTGERLEKGQSHVDHEPPHTFQRLLEDFVTLKRLNPAKVPISGRTADNSFRLRLADGDLEKAWIEYHNQHAKLRVISQNANLSIVGQEWDTILEYCRMVDSGDVLISWKGTERYYTHLPGIKLGILMASDKAPDNVQRMDGTLAVIEMSVIREKTSA